jgi:osmoprotectant transport system ATP-binding protein
VALQPSWPGALELTATPALIELDRVAKSFDGGRSLALQGVSLKVAAASFVCVVGGSGSGKTTTMKMMNRLIEPDSGTVRFEGADVDGFDPPTLRRRIGYVFQGIGLFPHMTIAENIAITPQLLGWPRAEVAARVAELLDLMDLPESFAARFPDALSGGQRQRVGVARALAARPRVMLMDEPFGALDPITRDGLGSAYRELHGTLGLTSVMVTHDVQEAVLLADRIVVMSAGRIIADDTPAALLAENGNPEVTALMATPRRQAERVRALLEAGGRRGTHG